MPEQVTGNYSQLSRVRQLRVKYSAQGYQGDYNNFSEMQSMLGIKYIQYNLHWMIPIFYRLGGVAPLGCEKQSRLINLAPLSLYGTNSVRECVVYGFLLW